MRSFTIHAPPPAPQTRTSVPSTMPATAAREKAPAPRGPVLVPEGFSILAALVPPLWFLAHRLWLVLALYVALAVLMAFLLPGPVLPFASLAAQLLVGFEAQNLRRWTLARHGLPVVGVVMAHDAEAALLRAFDARPSLAKGLHA
jgi:hypothetical protein